MRADMIQAIAFRSQAVLLVVISVATHALVGVDRFKLIFAMLFFVHARRTARAFGARAIEMCAVVGSKCLSTIRVTAAVGLTVLSVVGGSTGVGMMRHVVLGATACTGVLAGHVGREFRPWA